jgi:hypothetical protein
MIISLWKWAYTRFISDPQVVTDLYFEHVDEINNALQCCACYSTVPPEYAICPNCKAQRGMEMVWVPGIEEDGGDIAFELNDQVPAIDPDIDAYLACADEPARIANTMQIAEKMFDECASEFVMDVEIASGLPSSGT